MDLELADYQRTVQSLENDISSRDAQLLTATQDANKLKETIDSLRNQLGVWLPWYCNHDDGGVIHRGGRTTEIDNGRESVKDEGSTGKDKERIS